MSSAKWRLFPLGLNELNVYQLLNLKALNFDVSKLYAQLEFIPHFAMASCLWVIRGWIYLDHQLGAVPMTLFVG